MRALAAALPTQLAEGFRTGLDAAPPATGRPTTVFCVGMGGSGISAELVRSVVESETPLTIEPIRAPELPRAVEKRSRVVLVSYSGDTWETLRAYDAAGRVGASRVVITSGGALGARAERDGVPHLPLPPGLPPRSAIGHVFGGLLGLLDPWFPESNEARVERITGRLARQVAQYAAPGGVAAVVAREIGSRVPVVCAESAFAGVARRWKTQIEENAKRVALFDEVPELFHNAIVAWDAISRREARRFAIVLLEWAGELAPTRRGLRHFARLVRERGVDVGVVPLGSEDRLEATLMAVSLGDHVSLFLADRRGVDPYRFDAIERLKSAIGSAARH